jgi:hypothetical protein
VIVKNVVFWDIKTQLVPHSKHITSLRYRALSVNVTWDLRFSRWWLWRMSSSRMWHRMTLVATDVSEKSITSYIRVKGISELVTTLAVTNFSPRWWRRYIPPKSLFLRDPYAATAQKTAFLSMSVTEIRVLPIHQGNYYKLFYVPKGWITYSFMALIDDRAIICEFVGTCWRKAPSFMISTGA